MHVSLVPRISLSLSFHLRNIKHVKIGRRVRAWYRTAPIRGVSQLNSYGGRQFCTRLFLSFNFLCIIFAWAKFKGRES